MPKFSKREETILLSAFFLILTKFVSIRQTWIIWIKFLDVQAKWLPLILDSSGEHIWLEGCPYPYKMEQSWECTFFETLYPYEDKIRMKKKFHHWTSDVQASMHGRSGPSRLD